MTVFFFFFFFSNLTLVDMYLRMGKRRGLCHTAAQRGECGRRVRVKAIKHGAHARLVTAGYNNRDEEQQQEWQLPSRRCLEEKTAAIAAAAKSVKITVHAAKATGDNVLYTSYIARQVCPCMRVVQDHT